MIHELYSSRPAELFQELPMEPVPARYEIVDFDELSPVACPCGQARRAFSDVPDFPGTIHRTEICTEAKLHYHNRLTETYYILKCEANARMALDGKIVAVKPGMCILIRPGVRHRAIGRMTVLIIVLPKFDPDDEVIVE
jgi:mannose-6-phosphate isomerase-like protein (cupin superfamily)